jgi:flavin reductase (DIM6/NTAB) family NADH-FMN oxidoreductase RutF
MLPNVTAIMTAAFENRRAGLVVSRVMRCGGSLPLIAVAVPSGQRLAMLIRDSRCFGLCLVDRSSRLLLKKFGHDTAVTPGDPFDTFATRTLQTGAPLLSVAAAGFDCEVVRHLDLEADHEIYVGQVVGVFTGTPVPAPLGSTDADPGITHAGAGI